MPGASVAIVARRHGINANQVFEWRKKYREGRLVPATRRKKAATAGPELIRIGVIDQSGNMQPVPAAAVPPCSRESAVLENDGAQVEIHLPNGIKVCASAGMDPAALRRVLATARDLTAARWLAHRCGWPAGRRTCAKGLTELCSPRWRRCWVPTRIAGTCFCSAARPAIS